MLKETEPQGKKQVLALEPRADRWDNAGALADYASLSAARESMTVEIDGVLEARLSWIMQAEVIFRRPAWCEYGRGTAHQKPGMQDQGLPCTNASEFRWC